MQARKGARQALWLLMLLLASMTVHSVFLLGTISVVLADDTCVGGETALLIQDVVPWAAAAGQDPLGAVVTELKAQGKDFCIASSADIAAGAIALSQFSEILISSAQTQEFYDNLFPDGIIHPDITGYVENGGILSANLADCAAGPSDFGAWATDPCGVSESTSYALVGGVRHVTFYDQSNDIADSLHLVITSFELPCPSGNCGEIFDDEGSHDDLDGWTYDSHGYFTNLPPDSTTILRNSEGQPVFVEYPFGSGVVIASLTTTEWRYVGGFPELGLPQEKKLLANELAYQNYLASLPQDPPPNPQELTESIIDDVESLVEEGELNKGEGRSLIAMLEQAIRQMDRGNTKVAIQMLQVFIQKVETYVNQGDLAPKDGQPLIVQANSIIGMLGG